MDVREVHRHAVDAVARLRRGEGPAFLECRTYRFVGHSRSDPATYRPPGELEEWQRRDPLIVARDALHGAGVPETVTAEADGAARDRVADAFATALAAPYPEPVASR
jgi:acetoin:2,6-dichlorophenolindophenol oxidoreductase subunit alpha